MSVFTQAIYNVLANDYDLAALLATYGGVPAVFTTDPVPVDATLPYIIAVGDVVNTSFDTKNSRGREIWRDVRCYTDNTGSDAAVEAIAERVRAILHRQEVVISGYNWIMTDVNGPIAANESDAKGRVVTVKIIAQEAV